MTENNDESKSSNTCIDHLTVTDGECFSSSVMYLSLFGATAPSDTSPDHLAPVVNGVCGDVLDLPFDPFSSLSTIVTLAF